MIFPLLPPSSFSLFISPSSSSSMTKKFRGRGLGAPQAPMMDLLPIYIANIREESDSFVCVFYFPAKCSHVFCYPYLTRTHEYKLELCVFVRLAIVQSNSQTY